MAGEDGVGASPAGPPKASRARRFRDGLGETLAWFKEHYCTIEPRTAALYRWVVGALCVADAIRHWTEARWFYSNAGVLTNHYHLFRPSSGYNFSIFHAFSTLPEVHIAFALAVFCHVCFMVGWHAKLFAALSFLLVTSLDNRLVMVENGGYVVVNLVVGYAMFLPIERRFSVDALLRSYRERKERTAAELNERYHPAWATAPFTSIAVFLVVLNLAVVYFFNVVNKSGQMWRTGETVHYVLYLNRMVTGIAVFFREHLPFWATRVATWATLVQESLLVMWIMSPYARRYTRTLAMIGIFALHFTFGIMMRLGPFSWFMIGWSFILVAPPQWEMLATWYRKKAAPRRVVYDGRSPVAFAFARLLTRLDRLELLHFEESSPDVERAELLAAHDPTTGQVYTGVAGLREIVRALPGGKYAYPLLRIASLGTLGPIVGLVSRRREGLARFFGLTVPPRGLGRVDEPSPLARSVRRKAAFAREGFLYYFTLCSVLQALAENKAIPPLLKPTMPAVMSATLGYPRLYQGWGMFAPNPITDDGSITVDAFTIDGRHVDPFTGKEPDLDLTDARGLGLGQIRQDYFNRIRLDRNQVFRQGLREYLQRWHLETGRPQDELVAFDVYWVRDQCPKPWEPKPTQNETVAILTWRKPNYQQLPGHVPIPPEPKVSSAEVADPKVAAPPPKL